MTNRPLLAELDPGRRAALRIRVEAALAFRDGGLPVANANASLQQDAIRKSLSLAALKALLDNRRDVSAAVRDAAKDLWRDDEQALHPVVRERLRRAKAGLEGFSCGHCAGEAVEAACRAEFDAVFPLILRRVGRAYADFAGITAFDEPEIYLELGYRKASFTPAESSRSLRAVTRFRDRDNDRVSIVTLDITDDSLGWSALCQLPYIFAHELLCHAYQGLGGRGRSEIDKFCAWTEGWMDLLAVDLTDKLLDSPDPDFPSWLPPSDAKRATHWRHEERIWESDLPAVSADQRNGARSALERLKELYQGACQDSGFGWARLRRFSLRFNLEPLTQEERAAIYENLASGLALFKGPELDELVSNCEQYTLTGDVQQLAGALNRLCLD